MSNFKNRRNFHVIVNNSDDFIRAKLILESYFTSHIKPDLAYYKSRVLVVGSSGILTCYTSYSQISYFTHEITLEDLLKYY